MVKVSRPIIEAVVMTLLNVDKGFESRYGALKGAEKMLGIQLDFSEIYRHCYEAPDKAEFVPRVREILTQKAEDFANTVFEAVAPEAKAPETKTLARVCANLGWSEEDALDLLTSLGDVVIKGTFKVVDGDIVIDMKTKQGVTLDALAKMAMENSPFQD